VLNERYPFYGPPGTGVGALGRVSLNFIRRGIRARILVDKLISRIRDCDRR
jgi:hypothetical protein